MTASDYAAVNARWRSTSTTPGKSIPTRSPRWQRGTDEDFGSQWCVQLLGLGLLVAACFVIVQSIRERRNQRRIPLPLALITFALLFDMLIVIGRAGGGYHGQSEYVMPQLVLLSAVVVYGAAHAPRPLAARSAGGRAGLSDSDCGRGFKFLTATNWGFATGSSLHRSTVLEARLAVNFSDVPASEQQCYEMRILGPPECGSTVARNSRTFGHISCVNWKRTNLVLSTPASTRSTELKAFPSTTLSGAASRNVLDRPRAKMTGDVESGVKGHGQPAGSSHQSDRPPVRSSDG